VADLRILVARAVTGSDLSDSAVHETALDRVGALGFADPLGGALWRLKYARERKQQPRAVYLLARRSRSVAREEGLRWRLCWLVVDEWLDDCCESCGGRRFLVATTAEVTRVCPVCQGTGVKRHSDQSRMRLLGFDAATYRKWEGRLTGLHQKLADADSRVWRQVARQLGWIGLVTLANARPRAMLREVAAHSDAEEHRQLEPALSTASGWA
jgi:hypothetical protein